MHLVEQHVIDQRDACYAAIDRTVAAWDNASDETAHDQAGADRSQVYPLRR